MVVVCEVMSHSFLQQLGERQLELISCRYKVNLRGSRSLSLKGLAQIQRCAQLLEFS